MELLVLAAMHKVRQRTSEPFASFHTSHRWHICNGDCSEVLQSAWGLWNLEARTAPSGTTSGPPLSSRECMITSELSGFSCRNSKLTMVLGHALAGQPPQTEQTQRACKPEKAGRLYGVVLCCLV